MIKITFATVIVIVLLSSCKLMFVSFCCCTVSHVHYTLYRTVSSGPLYCLEDVSNHMLAGGGEDGIKLWKWDELTRNTKVPHPPHPP